MCLSIVKFKLTVMHKGLYGNVPPNKRSVILKPLRGRPIKNRINIIDKKNIPITPIIFPLNKKNSSLATTYSCTFEAYYHRRKSA